MTSGSSTLQNKLAITLSGTCANLVFHGAPGASYLIQWAPSISGPWTNFIPPLSTDATGQISYSDCVYATARFYRTVAQ